ncbi:MAG: amidohydrolase family protein [Acidimicrobiaceae bacterium]|nr:amidohydrolase family protein [Acidimicrobiaceae bacterium]
MATIDADAHVVESEETWSYMRPEERRATPVQVELPEGAGARRTWWAIDGRLISTGPVSETDAVKAVRELSDVDGRLRQMDEIGTDIQVLFPTIFLRPLTTKPAVEEALCRSYNRWLAERTSKGGGRLRWVVVPPTMSIDAAIEEIRFGYEHGASGVFWRGFEAGRLPDDEAFSPILTEVDRLGLALCVHAANGTFELHDAFPSDTGIWRFKVPGITAFQTILSTGLARRYPKIRFGFIELSAQWVPYVLHDFVRRAARRGADIDPSTVMTEHRLFVACQTDDDLPYILRYAGPHHLVAGTDFGHADTSSELLALQRLRDAGAVEREILDNILDANARALYGID